MAISDRITSIEEHIKESYQELEGLGIDTTGVNNNLENIPKLLDGYWETLPKVTGEGTSISLNNTLEGKMKIVLKGNTSQATTTGKNLFDDIYSDYTRPADYIICPITLEQGQTYTLSSTLIGTKVTGIVAGIVPYGEKYTDFVNKLNLTIESDGNTYRKVFTVDETYTSPKLVLYVGSNPSTLESTFDNIFNNYHIQLEKGNIVSPTYEPYTNGASPNPDYPQDVHVVTGDNTIKVEGKNKFPSDIYNQLDISGTAQLQQNGYYKINFPSNKIIMEGQFEENTQYTISASAYGGASGNSGVLGFNYTDGSSETKGINQTTAYNYFITSSANKTIKNIKLTYGSANTTYIKNLQLEKGSTATTYEEYKSTSYPISLGDIQLLHIPNTNYYDKIDKSSGKNLFNPEDFITAMSTNYREIKTTNGVEFICLGRSQSTTTTYTYELNCKENTQYTLSFKYISSSCNLRILYSDGTDSGSLTPDKATLTDVSFTSASNKTITGISLYCGGWYASGNKLEITQIMLNEGTTALEYEPYGTSWYLKKEIGKVVLDENISMDYNGTAGMFYAINQTILQNYKSNTSMLSDYLLYSSITWVKNCFGATANNVFWLYIENGPTSLADFQSWLSTHNTIVYYALQNPTYTEITDSTLLSQLNALAKSYEGQTNISQENNDLASLLNATALGEME